MRVVMLGTGTDVGKTYITARLAQALRTSASVLALKPIESGVDGSGHSDAEQIALGAGHAPAFSPWRFPRPVSPHLAARDLGHRLELSEIVAWVHAEERRHAPQITLLETAGGALSPLGPGVSNASLAAALEPALWILVAPDSLGVLHDVSATLSALPRAPDAVVLTAARPEDASSGSNAGELELLGITKVLATVSHGGEAGALARWLMSRQT